MLRHGEGTMSHHSRRVQRAAAEVAIDTLLKRYDAEGEAAYEPRPKRPTPTNASWPNATGPQQQGTTPAPTPPAGT